MRYIISSLAILAMIAGLTMWSSARMNTVMGEMRQYLDETERAEDRETQLAVLSQMEAYWDEQRVYLESVVVHNDLEDAGVTMSNLISAALCDDDDDFLAAMRLMWVQLEHIERMEQLRLGNIL